MTDSTVPPQSVQTLYREHHGWLRGWLQRRMGCAADAADLSHDTYLRILVSGRIPQPEQSRAFLTQVAKGLMIDLLRRRRLERAYLDALATLPEGEAPSLETQAQVVESLMLIDAALDRLPTRSREAFLLSQFEGLTYAEIAARLGVSVSCIRKDMLKAAAVCLAVMDAP